jgi:cell division transport system permease protein
MFGYLINEGFVNVFKNKKSTSGSLAIMCATMLIFGLFFVIIQNINNMIYKLEEKQGMQVFVVQSASTAQYEEIGSKLRALEGILEVKPVSKDDALTIMREKLGSSQGVMDGMELDNPFPASYVITLKDLSLASQVKDQINKWDNILEIKSRDETIMALVVIGNGVKIVSTIILIILVLISIFIISNTIKLTVHSRRKEISIMKYVGATDSFIRWPFIVEGIIIGIFSAIISIIIVGFLYTISMQKLADATVIQNIGIELLTFKDMAGLIIAVYLGIGIGIGALGSAISMRKYLKV